MYKKYIFTILVTLGACGVFAQTSVVVREVAGGLTQGAAESVVSQAVKAEVSRSFEAGLREGGQWYISRNTQIGKEIMAGESVVGTPSYRTYHNVKNKTQFLGENLSSTLARRMAGTVRNLPQFPAYYQSFPRELAESGKTLGVYEGILEAAYGVHTLFDGTFVRTFDEALALTTKPVNCRLSAQAAINEAITKAAQVKSGFFVIVVGGNERRAKDVLLLDLHKHRFISLNRSRARMWEMEGYHYGELAQGIELRENPSYYTVSKGDKIWAMISHSSPKGQEIAQAYHKGYYIYFEPKDVPEGFSLYTDDGRYFLSKDYVVSFAASRGQPLFKTVAEVDEFLAAQPGN